MSFFFDSENLFHWPYLWRTIWHARQSATPRLCFILQCLSVPAVLWRTRRTNRPWVSGCGVWCCLSCRPADCYHEVIVHCGGDETLPLVGRSMLLEHSFDLSRAQTLQCAPCRHETVQAYPPFRVSQHSARPCVRISPEHGDLFGDLQW